MPWINIGEFALTNEWNFSDVVQGDAFRVKHVSISDNVAFRGVIAQGFRDEAGEINIFNPQVFTNIKESEIFTFGFPTGLNQHSLCFKRLDESLEDWTISIDIFVDTPDQNLVNYLKTRFGGNTVSSLLIETFLAETASVFGYYQTLEANEPVKIVTANDKRICVFCNSRSRYALLATGFDGLNPLQTLLEIPESEISREYVLIPRDYKGDVYVLSKERHFFQAIEFILK